MSLRAASISAAGMKGEVIVGNCQLCQTRPSFWPKLQSSCRKLYAFGVPMKSAWPRVEASVLVSRAGVVPEPTGADKTTVVLFQREDHPGGWLSFLEQFATRGINLSRIESRPTGERLGDYCFSIDCEGHVADERVGEALMGLRRVCAQVRFLGSYGRADLAPATVAGDTTDDAFIEARDWLGMLRRPLP